MQREGVTLMRCYVRWWVAVGLLGALVLGVAPASAQVRQYASGQTVVPVYEGWEKNVDGSFNLVFGYFNRNWEESLDIPTGPSNFLEPGVADQGQPTRFYPRRSQFIFRVRVPADFGDQDTRTAALVFLKRFDQRFHPRQRLFHVRHFRLVHA